MVVLLAWADLRKWPSQKRHWRCGLVGKDRLLVQQHERAGRLYRTNGIGPGGRSGSVTMAAGIRALCSPAELLVSFGWARRTRCAASAHKASLV
ncbi:hypothetical protein NDU88_004339 [Pleurodeles waltl]|uniref:Uncharacterized protein n=1 Tax=Pleurodeles waltl TaxID=8319 RepID=A0AAV7QI40_PLEWA|nr:hypothetical protein NDU88_004339 [Pleurodeles waltl]